jgi:methionyl aminopeptidase
MSITIKDAAGIAGMREACRLAVRSAGLPHAARPAGHHHARNRPPGRRLHGQRAGHHFGHLGYQPPGYPPYPASLCTSVNHVVCHGIPNDKPLKKGDIVNVDVTVITKDGWFGDNSRMYIIGDARSPPSACAA